MNQWLQFSLWLTLGIGTLATIDSCVGKICNAIRPKEDNK